jgi:hypothetical protein
MVDELDPDLEALLREEAQPAQANGQPRPATTTTAAPSGRPKHRRPNRRGPAPIGTASGIPGVPPGGAPPAAPTAAAEPAPAATFQPSPTDAKNALVVWPRILEEQAALGIPADQIGINVKRYTVGPQKREAMTMAPLDGSLVCGGDGQSPAEALYDWIVNYYHLTYTNPAMYQLTFFYRLGHRGAIPGVAELTLDSPEVIRRQLEAADQVRARRAAPTGYAPPARTPYGFPIGAPPTASSTGASQKEIDLLRQLAGESGYYRGLLEQREKGLDPQAAPPAPPMPPVRDPRLPPPGLSEEEWDEIQARRQAKTTGPAVVQALTAMGFTPAFLQSLVGVVQKSQVPAPPQASPDPFEPFKNAIGVMKAYREFQSQVVGMAPEVAGALGEAVAAAAEEDPTMMKPVAGGMVKFPGTEVPMSYGPKLDDESWAEYFIRWGTHNPGAMAKVMEKVAGVLDPKAFSELMSAFAKKMSGAPPTAPQPSAPTSAPQAPGVPPPPTLGWAPRE